MLLMITYLGRAWLTHSALLWAVSASLTLLLRWLCHMAGKVVLAVGWKTIQGCGQRPLFLFTWPFHGLLGIPHTTVAGFPEQVFEENREEVHSIFIT